ncbi:hypothetical protein [Streptomyces sp. NPDC047108]|uniref:hypothetical protein n=1 Tax=Streptomyces sp. NPDC047108 TaxID=3155025 RepID=UPI0033FC8D92
MTTDTPGPEDGPHTPSLRSLRIASGIALALLPVAFFASVLMIIDEALGPMGPTVLYDISFWVQVGSALLGLAVLLLPARTMDRPTRKALLIGQCALIPVSLALAAAA